MSDYTARGMMNTVMATYFAGDYAGVTHAGLAVVAADTGLVLMAQRIMDPTDDPAVQESWEFPGGGLEPGEEPLAGAIREFGEETGLSLPPGRVINGWRAPNGIYQGFVYLIDAHFDLTGWSPTEETQDVAWVPPRANRDMKIRPEMADFDWTLLDVPEVSGNQEDTMDNESPAEDAAEPMEEPALSYGDIAMHTIPIHGVMAPEGVETGDGRGFNDGSITSRPLRIPFSWQKFSEEGHNRSVVVGSVDRLMRQGGLIHWEGQLMCCSEEGDEFANLLAFFGTYGVSIDGDKGSIDSRKTSATEVLWFDAVRAAGLTAVAIPAFHEAYVAFGPHPDMPTPASEGEATMAASGLMAGQGGEFKRGPGWVTDPKATKRIHDYWMPGHPGGDKIAWGTPGDFARAKALIGEKIGLHSPDKIRFLNAIIAQWHHDALGYWPATHAKMDHAGAKASADVLVQAAIDALNASAAAHGIKTAPEVSGNFTYSIEPLDMTLADNEDVYCLHDPCDNRGEFVVSSDDPMWNGVFCGEHAPEHEGKSLWADYEDAVASSTDLAAVTQESEDSAAWEAVLVSSVATSERTYPSAAYFDRHPDTDALVIEEPDEFGFRRTYGYAGEWGVCHVGFEDRCVGLPEDEGAFPEFHLGRTRTNEGYLNTGLITYKVDHRGRERMLTETAQQQHFDNVANAWAAVRLGQDERGIWFSGVVLPTVPFDDLILIEAAGQVSGEWKYGALRALQAVNVPGFPVLRSSVTYDEAGEVELLVASAFNTKECEPTLKERMEALAAADAEVRFARLKKEWS